MPAGGHILHGSLLTTASETAEPLAERTRFGAVLDFKGKVSPKRGKRPASRGLEMARGASETPIPAHTLPKQLG